MCHKMSRGKPSNLIILIFILGFAIVTLCNDVRNVEHQKSDEGLMGLSSNSEKNSNNKKSIFRRGQRLKNYKNGIRYLPGLSKHNIQGGGSWPPVLNVAAKSSITVNATCGQNGAEEYCDMNEADSHRSHASHCEICDANSTDFERRHLIEFAIDGTNRYWQSPSLQYNKEFEHVTITLDLKQNYQIAYIKLVSAISPTPASWILEKSLDGKNYEQWQYFSSSDSECLNRYNLSEHHSTNRLRFDTEVTCNTKFSKQFSLENGKINLSLMNHRPGVNTSSIELLKFLLARYVRIRLQGMHKTERRFYSFRHIKIGGRIDCSGHASETTNLGDDMDECVCLYQTCGINCEKCCPMYNQRPYLQGTLTEINRCEKCECNGHASECYYNPEVDKRGLSINTEGIASGGGVCLNCTALTAGINCDKCIPHYYRPYNVAPDAANPCVPCECDANSSSGPCSSVGGECNCKPGFTGPRCLQCEPGYEGEQCTKCPCDVRGSMHGSECESHCQCKLHVEGNVCDKCLPGYFGLSATNSEGCMKCYCSGVSQVCSSHEVHITTYQTLENWKVTDISKQNFAFPSIDNDTGHLVIGMYEFPETEAIYWLAPQGYCGILLENYGSYLSFHMAWIIVRGDTSGKPTSGPSVILIGRNGMKIARGDYIFKHSNVSIDVLLTEDGWYHVPFTVKDIVARLRRTEYRGDPVTRVQFMSVLSDVENILIRGTFHTDQVESILISASLHSGHSNVDAIEFNLVEKCECPIGYSGLSCERCEFGYVRAYENSSAHEKLGKCIPCACNGHALDCDLELHTCGECQHNTIGGRCELCAVGYYGNAMYGTEHDCKRCSCPLVVDSNNFSPSCQLKELSTDLNLVSIAYRNLSVDYICTQCPDGYTGSKCEICDDGFYGHPEVVGSKCLPCPCNGDPCDSNTGRCVACLRNTEGWRCERCKAGYWGDPHDGCELCNCWDPGTISNVCDVANGQCICKPRYSGHQCDECEFGYGNITLSCPECECNINGSSDSFCDTATGQCPCKMGIEGLKCDTCIDTYFGLSSEGCEDCRCNPYGSLNRSCNKYHGQCHCLENVIGRQCDRCQSGYWHLESGRGCKQCLCNSTGSDNNVCDYYTGQCNCKPGVGGIECSNCLDGYYGYSVKGCRKCDECTNSAFICDSESGRCVCPELSKGSDCQHCYPNSWGWEHRIGCKLCDCDHSGSIGQSCDLYTGYCICREGYTGRRCDQCAQGYYNYPNCNRCGCNKDGSVTPESGVIQCDDFGQCPCKSLVTGQKCDQCRQSTFGISKINPDGCTRCFCFGRSQNCRQSDLIWGQIRSYGSRNLSVEYLPSEYEYVIVIQMEGSRMSREDAEIEIMNGLYLIPSSIGNVSIRSQTHFQIPLYFQLPVQFYGDRLASYNGFLKYSVTTEGQHTAIEKANLRKYPLVQLHTHNDLVLDYYESEVNESGDNTIYVIPMKESYWRYHYNGHNITRAIMMTAMQNIRHIFVRGTSWTDFTQVVIYNVTLDTGIYVSGAKNNIAIGVEACDCPHQHNGTSCQDPSYGHYRWIDWERNEEELDDFIGRSVPCNCNGRSDTCDMESGYCNQCRDSTGGANCEICQEGYYGDPNIGCQACPCPETNRNFARGCTIHKGKVSCICKTGYTGQLCDKCMLGFYGNTEGLNGKCSECDCDRDGIVSNECDEITGQCNCKPGLTGRRCDRCDQSKYILQDSQCRICDNCTLTLLASTDQLAQILDESANRIDLNGVPAPWSRLLDYENQSVIMEQRLDDFYVAQSYIEEFQNDVIEKQLTKASHINKKLQKIVTKINKRNQSSDNIKFQFLAFLNDTNQLTSKIQSTIDELNYYGTHDHHINLPTALNEAQQLLDNISTRSMNHEKSKIVLMCARDTLDFWSTTSETLTQQTLEVEQLNHDAAMINSRLDEALVIGRKTQDILDEVVTIHGKNSEKLMFLVHQANEAKKLQRDIFLVYNNSIVPQTDELYDEISDSQTKLLQIMEDINVLKDNVNDTNAECADGLADIRENYLPDAKEHSDDLMKRAIKYANLFKNAKDGASVALMASTAYKDIINAILSAEEMTSQAINAVAKSQEKLYPSSGMSVIDIGMMSMKISHDIQNAVQEINGGDLEDNLKGHQKVVDTIKNTIWQTGLTNNNISSILNTLNNNATMKVVSDHMNTSVKISDQMREVRRGAVDISSDVYKLKLKLTSLEPQWDTKLGMAEENVSQSLSNIRAANNTLNNIETISAKNIEKFQKWNNTIRVQLQELRDKIAKARHATEGIRVSLESNTPKCIRSYIPHAFGLTTSNTIKMSIALSINTVTSPLVFIQGDNSKFIAIEMVKRKIRLVWNLGGDTAIVTHPVEIQTRDPKYDDAWYQIEVNRTMNLGSLVVRQMTNLGTFAPAKTYTGLSSANHNRLMISNIGRIWVGGVPADIKPRELQSDVGLGVVVHQLFFDENQIGLWHFTHSEGQCNGAMLGAHGASYASNSRHFNGEGYSAISRVGSKLYKNNFFSLQITFKTLDENALLFLAVDEKNNRSISLTLHDGRLVFRIDYGSESKLEINTTKKYNIGQWVKVEASRAFTKKTSENGNLKVNNEEEKTGSPTTPITSNLLPELSDAIYYLGGVPPGFRSGITKAPGADHAFLGCMKDLQINEDAYDPLDSSSYFGVEPTCKDSLTKAGFNGNGYIELPSHSLRKRANFSFVFRTLQPECLILLSAYSPTITDEYDSKDKKGNYSVSLINGRAHIWIDAGTGRLKLSSNATVNDGEYHVLSVQRQGRKFELRIDDEFQSSKSFSSNRSAINMPGELGGLYFGGAPDYPEYDNLAPASAFVAFQGSIKDVVFNNNTVLFNEALTFKNVQIGRSGPPMGYQGINNILMKTEPIENSFTAAPEGCHRVGIYSYEPNAFKFGDGPHSHSIINIQRRHLWQKNFNIQFDFRTFYPNGVLFVSPGTKEKPKHFLGLVLRDGQLNLIVRGRKKEELNLPKQLNDGQWHHVTLNSVAKKLTIRVEIGMNEQYSSATIKLPKKISAANMIYVGGVSDNSFTLPVELVAKLEEFKGCVRRFKVNNNTQDLVRPGKHFNVGQCFPRVEKGSYFPGDAYAVYKKNFHVGKYLELEFEFRTSELNGVLISVSEPVGFPALSIELHNGKVVMSCDLGDGNPFRVETHNLPSKYTVCDNKWHNITAMYDSEQIALRIDNYDSLTTLAQYRSTSGKVHTKSPLYIGGLPDTAPSGTLMTRDSFKGCIRNVLIRDELKDWTDMDDLHNVLLSECLAIH